MIRKTMYFLCIFFALTSSFVMANETEKPYNIKINDILMSKDVARQIFNDAKNNHVAIYNARNTIKKVDVVAEGTDVIIENSQLMDTITKLYSDAIINSQTGDDIICKRSEGNKIVMYIKVKKEEKNGAIIDLIIN